MKAGFVFVTYDLDGSPEYHLGPVRPDLKRPKKRGWMPDPPSVSDEIIAEIRRDNQRAFELFFLPGPKRFEWDEARRRP